MSYPNIKKQVLDFCQAWANDRRQAIQKKEANLQEALLGASKSSAGDKHNTERAMLQIEREQLGNQLAVLKRDQDILDRIDHETNSNTVRLGSLVYTTNTIYFVSVSAGIFSLNNRQIIALSSATPIGQQMLGKSIGDSFSWQGEHHKILAVY
jgi:transcription elongation GreA/GreB family factor